MKTIDFLALSVCCGLSLTLADRMISHSLNSSSGVKQVANLDIDTSYVHRLIANKEYVRCISDVECKVMAQAIYFEGRGETPAGQIAIGQVIKKRSIQRSMSIRKVVYQKNIEGVCQFSYICDIEKKRVSSRITERKAWGMALKYAYGVLNNKYPNYSKGADHYFNPNTVASIPEWSKKMIHVSSIKNHVFYLSKN